MYAPRSPARFLRGGSDGAVGLSYEVPAEITSSTGEENVVNLQQTAPPPPAGREDTLGLIWLLRRILVVFLALAAVLKGIDLFLDLKLITQAGWSGLAIAILLSALGATTDGIRHLKKRIVILNAHIREQSERFESRAPDLETALLAELERGSRQKQWDEVIKLGTSVSRVLWVTARLSTRIKLGRLVEAAAVYTHNFPVQASVLIDDLGWTRVAVGDVVEGEESIKHGISIAERTSQLRLVCRGYRHLAGVAMRRNDFVGAEAHLVDAEEREGALTTPTERAESQAAIHYLRSNIRLHQRQWDDGLREIDIAQAKYGQLGNRERELKCHSTRAEIYLGMGKTSAAKDAFREGLVAAREVSQRDAIIRNLIGCAEVALIDGEGAIAAEHYSEAAEVAKTVARNEQAEDLYRKAQRARGE